MLAGRDRVQTEAFDAFRGAYPLRAEFCAPAKGWESVYRSQNPNESRIHWMIRRSEHVRKQQKPALSGRNGWQSGPDSAVSRLTPWWWPASRTANRVEAGEFRGAHGVQWLCRGPASCERLQTQVDPKPL